MCYVEPRMQFEGEGIQLLGWMLLAIPGVVLIVPFPFFLAAFFRWFVRNLSFRDGATAVFAGRGEQVFGWALLALLAGGFTFGPRVHSGPRIRIFSVELDWWGWSATMPWWTPYAIAAGVLLWLLGVLGQIHVIRWFVREIRLSTAERFEFHGTYPELLAWEILNGLAAITIIGWAWTTAAAYRWAAEHTRSERRALRFHGAGFEILWRTFAMVLFCLPILTIPWAVLWYLRWLVSQVMFGPAEAFD